MYGLAMFIFVVSMLTFVLGWLRPSLFKFLGTHATRRHIAVYSIGLILISTVISSTFEPSSIQQARTDRENRNETSEEQKAADIIKEQQTAEHNIVTPPPSEQAENKTPEPQHQTPQPTPQNTDSPLSRLEKRKDVLDFNKEPVKRSRISKTCYTPGMSRYKRIISYKAFKTLDECLASGGRRAS